MAPKPSEGSNGCCPQHCSSVRGEESRQPLIANALSCATNKNLLTSSGGLHLRRRTHGRLWHLRIGPEDAKSIDTYDWGNVANHMLWLYGCRLSRSAVKSSQPAGAAAFNESVEILGGSTVLHSCHACAAIGHGMPGSSNNQLHLTICQTD